MIPLGQTPPVYQMTEEAGVRGLRESNEPIAGRWVGKQTPEEGQRVLRECGHGMGLSADWKHPGPRALQPRWASGRKTSRTAQGNAKSAWRAGGVFWAGELHTLLSPKWLLTRIKREGEELFSLFIMWINVTPGVSVVTGTAVGAEAGKRRRGVAVGGRRGYRPGGSGDLGGQEWGVRCWPGRRRKELVSVCRI